MQALRFSQDSVCFEFSDASGNLLDMVTQLLDTGDFSSVQLAAVVQQGVYYSCNNRRLSSLKVYAHLSRAVVKTLHGTLSYENVGTNQAVRVGRSFFTPYFDVPCVVRRFSQYNCSHDVECHGTPADTNVLYPKECKDVSIRRKNLTSHQLSRVLAQMFLSDRLEPTVVEAMRRLPRTSLAELWARATAVREDISRDQEHRTSLQTLNEQKKEEKRRKMKQDEAAKHPVEHAQPRKEDKCRRLREV